MFSYLTFLSLSLSLAFVVVETFVVEERRPVATWTVSSPTSQLSDLDDSIFVASPKIFFDFDV